MPRVLVARLVLSVLVDGHVERGETGAAVVKVADVFIWALVVDLSKSSCTLSQNGLAGRVMPSCFTAAMTVFLVILTEFMVIARSSL